MPSIRRMPPCLTLTIGAVLAAGVCTAAMPAWAQDRPTTVDPRYPDAVRLPDVIVPLRRGEVAGVQPERSVDANGIAAYGFNSIRDLTDALASETGEDDPVILVNGQRIEDFEDVADFPVEALERVDILPPGSGARVGASPRGRVLNVVLRPEFRTVILTGAIRAATAGDNLARSGEANLTRIQGPNRINLVVRVRDDDWLLESDRGVSSTQPDLPYGVLGTVLPDPRSGATEIDPALSAAAGQPVARAAVPSGSAPFTLTDFVATAGMIDTLELGRYRTLIPSARSVDAVANVTQMLGEQLRGSLNARLGTTETLFLSGPAYGLFLLPASHPDSPFSSDVAIAAVRERPLGARSQADSAFFSSGLNLPVAEWNFGVLTSYSRAERNFESERRGFASGTGLITIDSGFNPFAGGLGALVPVSRDVSTNLNETSAFQLTAFGPAIEFPAGPVRLTLGGGLSHSSVESTSTSQGQFSRRALSRSEAGASAIVAVPITKRQGDFLPVVGDLDATFEVSATDSGSVGLSERISAGLNWTPSQRFRVNASVQQAAPPPPLELLAAAPISSPDTPYLDTMTGATANVTITYGGNPDLRSSKTTTHRIGLNTTLWPRYNLQFNAEYLSLRTSDAVSALPPISTAVMLAFPERFTRDGSGLLTQVDIRPINLNRQEQEQVRYGVMFQRPVTSLAAKLEVVANHSIALRDEIVIRTGLPVIDALNGGGLGFPGGRVRRRSDASVAFTAADWGLRGSAVWTGASQLTLGSNAVGSELVLEPFQTIDATAYLGGKLWAPGVTALAKTRLTLTLINLMNNRQGVRRAEGAVPFNYQPRFRSPLGRTIAIELRSAF